MRATGLPSFVLCALACAACTAPASAQVAALDLGLALPSTLRLTAGADDQGGDSLGFDLDYALPGGQRLRFAGGRSHAVNDQVELEPRTWRLGVGSDPLDQLTVSLELEDWGQRDEITTRSLRGSIETEIGDWFLGLAPGLRRIEIFLGRGDSALADSVTISASTLEVRAGSYLTDKLYLAASFFENSYSQDPGRLRDVPATRISPVAFNLAAGLQDHGAGLGAYLAGAHTAVALDWTRSVSAVDDAESDSLVLGFDFTLSASVSLLLDLGRQASAGESTLSFTDVALLLSF